MSAPTTRPPRRRTTRRVDLPDLSNALEVVERFLLGERAEPDPRPGGRAGRRAARDRRGAVAAARLPQPDRRRRRLHRGRRARRCGSPTTWWSSASSAPTRRPRWSAPGAAATRGSPSGRPACSTDVAIEGPDPEQRLTELAGVGAAPGRGAADLRLAPPPRQRRQPAAGGRLDRLRGHARRSASSTSSATPPAARPSPRPSWSTGSSTSRTRPPAWSSTTAAGSSRPSATRCSSSPTTSTAAAEIALVMTERGADADDRFPPGARRARVRRRRQPPRRRLRPGRQHRLPADLGRPPGHGARRPRCLRGALGAGRPTRTRRPTDDAGDARRTASAGCGARRSRATHACSRGCCGVPATRLARSGRGARARPRREPSGQAGKLKARPLSTGDTTTTGQ